ncbi:protein-disulfide reductase DsbD family protein [Thalassoroseus pseudoceratinae]|uniref:protein-disulfide reductase DsbD family protein n=1 Tax=Thalassoroseus pseudoceratinae TaxID=2713176 RepID=UPI0014224459|nr:cytochrome c biogenesis protein CcdA [Thalassoroseus pseudoceratinae]
MGPITQDLIRRLQRAGILLLAVALILPLSGPSVSAQEDGESLLDLFNAGNDDGPIKPKSKSKADVSSAIKPVNGSVDDLKAGDQVVLEVTINVPTGGHIYSQNTPKGGPTIFKVSETVGLKAVDEKFTPDHKPKREFNEIFEGDVEEFHKTTTFSRKYEYTGDVPTEDVKLTGAVDYQVCVAGSCRPLNSEIAVTLAGAAPVAGSTGQFENIVKKTGAATVSVKLSPTDAAPGDTVTLSVTVKMPEDRHTYSTTQPPGNAAQATKIDVTSVRNLEPKSDEFTADRKFEIKTIDLGFKEAKQESYEDEVTWSRTYTVQEAAGDDGFGVIGEYDGQVCNESSCVPIGLEFNLGSLDPDAAAVAPTTITSEADESSKTDDSTTSGAELKAKGLVYFIGWAAISGALSLLTPCVFPMIPITVSFFLKQAEKAHHRPATLAMVYSGSIMLTFTVLGLLIAVLFRPAALNAFANSVTLNVVLGLVLVFFGISMLGFFELTVPSWLLTWSSNKESKGGMVGTVFMALTFTLVSFTCTFPVAGTVLVWASKGDYLWPIIGMVVFSGVFSAPFFLLALFPAFLKSMPKSGGWMTNVKVTLGLLEIGAALKFLSTAELSYHTPPTIFTFDTVMMVWFLVAAMTTLYILGIVRFSCDSGSKMLTIPRILIAIPFLLVTWRLGYLMADPEAASNEFDKQVIAFAPPQFGSEDGSEHTVTDDPVASAILENLPGPMVIHEGLVLSPNSEATEALTKTLGPHTFHDGLVYSLDFDTAVAYAKQTGRSLFLDFTGVNCVNCRLMEKRMAEPQNRDLLNEFVRVQLYTDNVPGIADADRKNEILEQNRKLQNDWFGDVSLPAYAVVTPNGETILSKYTGLEREKGDFANFLDEGLTKWRNQADSDVQTASAKADSPR